LSAGSWKHKYMDDSHCHVMNRVEEQRCVGIPCILDKLHLSTHISLWLQMVSPCWKLFWIWNYRGVSCDVMI